MPKNADSWLDMSWVMHLQPILEPSIDIVLLPGWDPTTLPVRLGDFAPCHGALFVPIVDPDWEEQLMVAIGGQPFRSCLLNLIGVPSSPGSRRAGWPRRGSDTRILEALLKTLDHGCRVVTLAPKSLLTGPSGESIRAHLAESHSIDWIVFLGGSAAQQLPAQSGFQCAALVVSKGPPVTSRIPITRLVDLRSVELDQWTTVLAAARQRDGGEGEHFNVLRGPKLDGNPWTYERFTSRFAKKRMDAARLGPLIPLRECIEGLTTGIHRTSMVQRCIDLDEQGIVPDDSVPCFSGRSILRGGGLGAPAYAVRKEAVRPSQTLRRGDILIRCIVDLRSPRQPIVAAKYDDDVSAVFDSSCFRMRFQPGVDIHSSNLLLGYLNSVHTRAWLIAHGVEMMLTARTLNDLEVPNPSEEVRSALGVLARAEEQYAAWAEHVGEVRSDLFAGGSYDKKLPVLLKQQRVETERLRAARDAESWSYQMRNYFPHPIALRRELIGQMDPGSAMADAILDCAEHLLKLLAAVTILEEVGGGFGESRVRNRIRSFVRDESLHFDWGKAVDVLGAGVQSYARCTRVSNLRFPELAELVPALGAQSTSFQMAEEYLRDTRNRKAHQERLPEGEMRHRCEGYVAKLDELLQATAFVSSWPLVRVEDYRLDRETGARVAMFQYLEGISTAFPRREETVDREIARGDVGFRIRGSFVSAFPWLAMQPCELCKRLEIFILSRWEQHCATYVAMETGHALEKGGLPMTVTQYLDCESSQ